jgi:hypothetical protein
MTFNAIRNNPQRIQTPRSRFGTGVVAGQWSMPRAPKKVIVNVQNNFYNGCNPWDNIGYQEEQPSGLFGKIGNAMPWIGLGLSAAGSLVDFFGGLFGKKS